MCIKSAYVLSTRILPPSLRRVSEGSLALAPQPAAASDREEYPLCCWVNAWLVGACRVTTREENTSMQLVCSAAILLSVPHWNPAIRKSF